MAENDSLTSDINYEHAWIATKHKFFVSVQLLRTLEYRKMLKWIRNLLYQTSRPQWITSKLALH